MTSAFQRKKLRKLAINLLCLMRNIFTQRDNQCYLENCLNLHLSFQTPNESSNLLSNLLQLQPNNHYNLLHTTNNSSNHHIFQTKLKDYIVNSEILLYNKSTLRDKFSSMINLLYSMKSNLSFTS